MNKDSNILDELIKAVGKFDLHTTNIFLGHPLDLLEMDMKQFPSNCYFISEHFTQRGQLLMVKDGELKEELYKFVKNSPDRVFRGENDSMDCYDCEIWERGRRDGACMHYMNNDCPYGYHDKENSQQNRNAKGEKQNDR